MLFCTSLVALVGAGEQPTFSPRHLQIINTKVYTIYKKRDTKETYGLYIYIEKEKEEWAALDIDKKEFCTFFYAYRDNRQYVNWLFQHQSLQ